MVSKNSRVIYLLLVIPCNIWHAMKRLTTLCSIRLWAVANGDDEIDERLVIHLVMGD